MNYSRYVLFIFSIGFFGQITASSDEAVKPIYSIIKNNSAAAVVRKEAKKKARLRLLIKRLAAGAVGVAGLVGLLYYYRTRTQLPGGVLGAVLPDDATSLSDIKTGKLSKLKPSFDPTTPAKAPAVLDLSAVVQEVPKSLSAEAIEVLRSGAAGDALGEAEHFPPTKKVNVSDDTIMTEVTIKAIIDWSKLPSTAQTEDVLMKMIADATLKNYRSMSVYSWKRCAGQGCRSAIEEYEKRHFWDRSTMKSYTPGAEGGSGKVMDSASFGLIFKDPDVAAHLSQIHSKISHPDISSQAGCAAFAYGISAALKDRAEGRDVNVLTLVSAMREKAADVSRENQVAEKKEWSNLSSRWPSYRASNKGNPFTLSERIADVEGSVARGVSLDDLIKRYNGWGGADLVAAATAAALWAEKKQWSVKDTVGAVVLCPYPCDRDTIAAVAAQLVAAIGRPLGFTEQEFLLIEGDAQRKAGGDLSQMFS